MSPGVEPRSFHCPVQCSEDRFARAASATLSSTDTSVTVTGGWQSRLLPFRFASYISWSPWANSDSDVDVLPGIVHTSPALAVTVTVT